MSNHYTSSRYAVVPGPGVPYNQVMKPIVHTKRVYDNTNTNEITVPVIKIRKSKSSKSKSSKSKSGKSKSSKSKG